MYALLQIHYWLMMYYKLISRFLKEFRKLTIFCGGLFMERERERERERDLGWVWGLGFMRMLLYHFCNTFFSKVLFGLKGEGERAKKSKVKFTKN